MDINPQVCSEVNALINIMDNEYQKLVPTNIKELLTKYKNNPYNIKYDVNKPLIEQNISKEALSIIAYIHLNYWCKNENEKNELNKIFKENIIKNETEKKLKYPPDGIFKNANIATNINKTQEAYKNVEMALYKKSIWNKIYNFFKNIYNKIKNH